MDDIFIQPRRRSSSMVGRMRSIRPIVSFMRPGLAGSSSQVSFTTGLHDRVLATVKKLSPCSTAMATVQRLEAAVSVIVET